MNIKILLKYFSCFIKKTKEEKIYPLTIEINPYNQKFNKKYK
jgi:hypothetical protein